MGKSKRKSYALWALQILLAVFYAMVATPKLIGNAEMVENFRRWGLPDKLYLLIGSLELLGAFGLLISRTAAWAAGGLILLMLCAAGTHIAHGEWSMLPMPVIPMLLLALVGYLRCPWLIRRETTTFEIVARRGKKVARDKATIKVNVIVVAAPTINLRSEPSAIESGQSATLRWSTANARTVTITGLGNVAASGERQVSPRMSTTYTGTAVGDGGTAAASARVTVTERVAKMPEPAKPVGVKVGPPIAEQFRKAITAIYFEFDEADLTAAAQEKLRRVADWLLQDPHRTISFRIEGNCDPRGTAEYNMGLGDRRARAAKNFLVSLGVDANRIDTISYGLEKAIGDYEGSPDVAPSWAHDRRDDFVYLSGGKQ
jgi:peptidoglycan-associated lipoprotein